MKASNAKENSVHCHYYFTEVNGRIFLVFSICKLFLTDSNQILSDNSLEERLWSTPFDKGFRSRHFQNPIVPAVL